MFSSLFFISFSFCNEIKNVEKEESVTGSLIFLLVVYHAEASHVAAGVYVCACVRVFRAGIKFIFYLLLYIWMYLWFVDS